jgi:hypothetical protein
MILGIFLLKSFYLDYNSIGQKTLFSHFPLSDSFANSKGLEIYLCKFLSEYKTCRTWASIGGTGGPKENSGATWYPRSLATPPMLFQASRIRCRWCSSLRTRLDLKPSIKKGPDCDRGRWRTTKLESRNRGVHMKIGGGKHPRNAASLHIRPLHRYLLWHYETGVVHP